MTALINIIKVLAFFHPVLIYSHKTVKKSCDSVVANLEEPLRWNDFTGNWTTYYVYNWWELEPEVCIGQEFRKVTKETIERFETSLEKQIRITPHLSNASLHYIMTPRNTEFLVFPRDKPGLVYGVPLRLTSAMEMMRESAEVPSLKFAMRTINDGEYLLVMDCADSTVTLSVRAETPVDRESMGTVAYALDFGDPHEVCFERQFPARPRFFG